MNIEEQMLRLKILSQKLIEKLLKQDVFATIIVSFAYDGVQYSF